MASVDNLDFELFGISNISDEFNPPFGELEGPVTGSLAPQIPYPLPLIAENFEVNFLDKNHVDDITQDSVRPKAASRPSNGLTTQNLNAVQPSTSSSLPRSSSSSKPTVKRNTARSPSKAQISGSSLHGPSKPYTAYDVSKPIETAKSLPSTQPATSELLDQFFGTTEWNTIDLTGVPQQSPPSSPHWGSCPSIIGKPPLNVDWNPTYLALGMTSWVTSNPDVAMNDAFNEGNFSQNKNQECTEVTLPSPPPPQYSSVASTDVMEASVPSDTQSTDCDASSATQPETQHEPGDHVSDQYSPSQAIRQGTSTDGLFTPSPEYSSLPSTDVTDTSVPSDTQSTDYTVSCAVQPVDQVSDQGSPSQDIGQGTSTDGLFTLSPEYSSLPSTDVMDTPVLSETQSTNYNASFATQPQHYASEQGSPSQDIGQRKSTNVTPPSTASPQYSSVPSTHVERVIPSYLYQSNAIPANTDASIVTQSQSRSNRTLGSPNTVPRTHNVTQPSTASTPHFSTPGPNGQNKSTPPHPSQQVPVKNAGSSAPAPLTRGPRSRKRPQGKSTNVTQPSTAPLQYSSADENTSIPSHPWQSTPVPVNNAGFFPIPHQQQAFNQGPPWQGRFINGSHHPSTPSLQTAETQYMAGLLPMPQRAATVLNLSSGNDQGLYNNPPLNWTSGFSGPMNVPQNFVNFPPELNYVAPNPQYTLQQHASSRGLAQLNQDTHHTYANVIVNNESSVAYNNQRLINSPNSISTTGYNANANVPNNTVPPTSGVSSVDLVNRQFFHSTPSTYMALGQGGTYYPSFNTVPSGFLPDPRNTSRLVPTIPVPSLPPSTHLPAPMQTNRGQPVDMLPSPSNSQPTSFTATPSTSGPVASAAGKRKRGDDESVIETTQKRRRGQERPESHLYQEIKKGKYVCLYAGPVNPHGCSAGPFTTMPSLLNHLRTVHAKREVEMNVPPAQRVAYNGLPAGLRTLGVVCPLRDADLMQCKYYRESNQRWRAQTMDAPEAAVKSHIASDHGVEIGGQQLEEGIQPFFPHGS